MRRLLRPIGIALAALALLAMPAASLAGVTDDLHHTSAHESEMAPPMLDALILRPLGLVSLAFGAVLWVPAQAMTLLTRPTDASEPTKQLILRPVKYTFVDPIGSH